MYLKNAVFKIRTEDISTRSCTLSWGTSLQSGRSRVWSP